LAPDPTGAAYSAPPETPILMWPTCKGRGRGGERRRGKNGRRGEMRGGAESKYNSGCE